MVGRHARARAGSRDSARAWGVVVLVGAGLGIAHLVETPAGGNTTPPVSTSSSTSTSSTTTAPATVTLAAVGDMELGNTPQLPPNPSTYLAPVARALAAPIVFGNLEGTLYDAASPSKCGSASTDCYAFRVPTSYARVYRAAGFTVLNSANNHSNDFAGPGVASTSAALRAAGIAQAGLPGQIAVRADGAVKVAFVDFAPYANTNDLLNVAAAKALIARARTLAAVVVVYMHAGAEGSGADHVTRATETFVGENRGNPYDFAHAAIDDGADLVIASGPHVLRGLEWYRGHLIDYSLGDFANYYDFAASGTLRLSAILHVTLSSGGAFVAGRFTSVSLDAAGRPSLDPSGAARTFVNALSRADFGAAAAEITPAGRIVAPH